MLHVMKLINNKGQYSVTIPKALVKSTGVDKEQLVVLWSTEGHIIHLEGYDVYKGFKKYIQDDRLTSS